MKKIIQMIQNNHKFLITAHVNPDPDALCSELAMAIFLKSLGKKVVVINEEDVPDRFSFFPYIKSVKTYKEGMKLSYDVAVILDCGDFSRIGKVKNIIQDDKVLLNIDHHITNDSFGDFNCVDVKASSTCEVLYEMITLAGCVLTKNLALHLYAGIMTDTGCFRYECTTPRTHAIASELRKFNFSATRLYQSLYESIPMDDMRNFAKITGTFQALYDARVLLIELKKKNVAQFSEEFDLRDSIFKYLRSIKGVEVFVILTEADSKSTRINLRSSGRVDVAKIASLFNGGGHKNASGCLAEGNMKISKTAVLNAIEKVL